MNTFAQQYLRETGAISKIIDSFRDKLSSPCVAKSGVSLIGVLSEDKANCDILASIGTYDIVINALVYHLSDQTIIDVCCKTLARLSFNNDFVLETVQTKINNYFNAEYAEYLIKMIEYYQYDNCSRTRS